MAHKYLNALGIESINPCIFNTEDIDAAGRQDKFMQHCKEHGFDERETWSLNFTLATWLYEHLKVYMDYADGFINLDFHHFDIPVLHEIPKDKLEYVYSNFPKRYYTIIIENHTQKEAILLMIEYLEYYLTFEDIDYTAEEELKAYEKVECAIKIFAEIFGAMWW